MDIRSYTDFSIISAKYITQYTGIWLPQTVTEERQRKISVSYTSFALLYGIWLHVMDIYNSWGDAARCMYLTMNMLCIGMSTIKMLILNFNRAKLTDAFFYAQRHFWHRKYTPEERLIFSVSVKYCTRYAIFALTFVHLSLSGYVVTPVVENLGRNKSDRILPFKIWTDLPLSETPYFELMFIIQADTSRSMLLTFVFHGIGSLIHLCFLTYTCHFMIEESTNIITTVYTGLWCTLPMNKVGRSLRSDIKFIMQRSLKPCYLTAGGFFPVSLETFTSLLSSTFSYFTLMRESMTKTEDE
nr:uncharacterized protein LOC117603886 isoform X2 [Osmia lignaria]